MYTKKILSMAATIALVSTASFAFEMNEQAQITVNSRAVNTYTGGNPVPENEDLNLSPNLRGDALIYPYFKSTDGWETEIVLRNTTPHATIAKVSVHEKSVSGDIGDFNVYLSPYDVIRFTLRDGRVYTADGSIPTQVRNPKYGVKKDEAKWLELTGNSEELEVLKLKSGNGTISETMNEGYVVVQGMAQYHDGDTHDDASYGQITDELNYHQQHEELFLDYRRLMDACRPGWRKAFNQNGMDNGTMLVRRDDTNSKYNGVPAPDTNVGAECVAEYNKNHPDAQIKSVVSDYNLENFGDVDADTFTGTVRVLKADGGQSRDLLLPATAISNFSVNNMYLWAEGEWASLADRRMKEVNDGTATPSYFNRDDVLRDSNTFLTKTALYTFDAKKDAEGEADGSVINQILITQPTKKILGQLFGKSAVENHAGYYWQYITQHPYGGFVLSYFLLDEDESADIVDPGFTRITSPAGNLGPTQTWNNEMQKITSDDLENLAANELFQRNDGYTYLVFEGAEGRSGLPAIVTEMSATKVGGFAQTNWIYAPTTKSGE